MGMGGEAKKERELMKGVWFRELPPWTSELNPPSDLCGPQSYLHQRVWKMGDLSPNSYQSLVRATPVMCQFAGTSSPPHTQAPEAPEAQKAPGRAAGAGHWPLGLPTVNHHALRGPPSSHHGAGPGEMGWVQTALTPCAHYLIK